MATRLKNISHFVTYSAQWGQVAAGIVIFKRLAEDIFQEETEDHNTLAKDLLLHCDELNVQADH